MKSSPPILLTIVAVLTCLYLPVFGFVAPVLGNGPTINWDLEGVTLLSVAPGLWLSIDDSDNFAMAGVYTALLGSFAIWVGHRTWFSFGMAAGAILGWSTFSANWLSALLWSVH
jgi:hypothetical protein